MAEAMAQSTAFAYQGRLSDGSRAANGTYDFKAELFGVASGGVSVAAAQTFGGVGVTNGLFTLTLDFGADAFNDQSRWIELGVRTNGAAAYTTLSPRRLVLASPQAVYSARAGSAASVPASAIYGTIDPSNLPAVMLSGASLNGGGFTNLNASQLLTGTVPDTRLSAAIARTASVDASLLAATNVLTVQILGTSNVLTGQVLASSNTLNARIYGTQADLQTQVNNLNARFDAFLAASYPASGIVSPSLPSGLIVASPIPANVVLLSQGLVQFARFDAPGWTTGSTLNAPGARHSHGSVWTGTSMIVWGGMSGTTPLNTGGMYDPANDVWTGIPSVNAPTARRGHAQVWTGEGMLVWGGQGDTFLGNGAVYTLANQT